MIRKWLKMVNKLKKFLRVDYQVNLLRNMQNWYFCAFMEEILNQYKYEPVKISNFYDMICELLLEVVFFFS